MKKIIYCFLILCNTLQAQVEEFLPQGFSGEPVVINNKLVFSYFTPDFGSELWVTDGTSEGTQLLKDIITGPGSSNPSISKLHVIDNVLYFRCQNTPHTIWRTDGTPQGTYAHVTNNQIFDPVGFIKTNGFIFFVSKIGGNDTMFRLWRMTSFTNSEVPITQTFDGKVLNNIRPNSVAYLNQTTLIFGAHTNQTGWAIFGTTGPTTDLIIDLYQGNNTTFNNYNQISNARSIDGKIYFTGFQESTGFEPWSTTGTASSTQLLKDIFISNTVNSGSTPDQWTKAGGTIYFTANDGINQRALWKTDGTTSGTQLVNPQNPINNVLLGFNNLVEFNNQLYFSRTDGGNHLFRTNGTEEGTVKITNTNIISSISSANTMIAGNKIFFSGFSSQFGNELFMVDENDVVTMVADINPGINGSDPGFVVEFNGYIYFPARFGNTANTNRTYRIAVNTLGIDESISRSVDIKISPNPTSDYFTIEPDADVSVEVYSLLGQKQNIKLIENNQFDISHLSNGVYMVKVLDKNSNTIATKKIIKQ